jgi:primase-polymerase (primpol)-like protein
MNELPFALMAFAAFPQFILCRIAASQNRPEKSDKFPIDYRTGQVANAHDPAIWLDATAAIELAKRWGEPYGVGFDFTEQDPFWFLDIDNCWTPNGWAPQALQVCNLLSGCAIEISRSGIGLHLFGCGRPPAHGCRNDALGYEFYHSGRFVALTGIKAQGSAAMNFEHVLPVLVTTYFPPDNNRVETAWSDGPVPEWSGIKDDQELIRRAINSVSPNAAFGNRASFADLWFKNVEVLGKAYPDPARDFDHSSADAALAQHLAFWTGNDCERIRRLMFESQLKREKWEREDYILRTILGAVSRQDDVYVDEIKRRQEQIAENLRIGKGSDVLPLAGTMTLGEMLKQFACILGGKRVIDLDDPRRIFTLDEWKNAVRASRTVSKLEDGAAKDKSCETSKLWETNPNRQQIDAVTFRPGFPRMTPDPRGLQAVNTWRPFERTPTVGDVSLFIGHVDYLLDNAASGFLDWLADIEQHPGVLPHFGYLHISPSHGTGRNWLASVLCRLWSGYVASSFDLAGTLRTGFNGSLSRKLLAVVDEIDEGGSNAKWENATKLKSLVTEEHRLINPKYGHQHVEYNVCRWLIFSNSPSALPLEESDRRFNVVRNDAAPRSSDYYKTLYAALKDREFINTVAQFLGARDISGFNPGAHAVMNEAKRELIAASRSEADETLRQLVRRCPADVISSSMLGTLLTGQHGGPLTPAHSHAIERAGIRSHGGRVKFEGAATRFRILRNYEQWKDADAEQIRHEFAKLLPMPFGNLRDWLNSLPSA